MKQLKCFLCGSVLAGALFSLACHKDNNGSVTILFDHRVGAEPLELLAIKYHAQAGHLYSVERLKYYISNFALHREDGQAIRAAAPHYREVGVEETATLLLPDVPDGRYTSLSFIIGLDSATNKPNGLPQTVQNINMEWPIPGEEGYHYMKFEGKYDSMGSGVVKSFNVHTGATNNHPYYVEVSLPLTHLTIDKDSWSVQLVMDLNEWFQNPHTYDFEQFGPGIMANEAAQQMLHENGASLFSVADMQKQ